MRKRILRLTASRAVKFAGLSSAVLRDEIVVPVSHGPFDEVLPTDNSASQSSELEQFLRLAGGSFFFKLLDSAQEDFALKIFKAEELEPAQDEFRQSIATNEELSPEEWAEFDSAELEIVRDWLAGLVPFGTFGNGADLLVLEQNRETGQAGRVCILYHDEYSAGGPPELELISDSWTSITEFLRWFDENLPESFPDTYRYTDTGGQQYEAIGVIRED